MTPVAITGIGLLTPLGVGPGANLDALLAGRSGLAAPVDEGLLALGVPGVGAVRAPTAAGLDRAESLALDAARAALADAGLAAGDLPGDTCLHVSTSKGPVAALETQLAGPGPVRTPVDRFSPGSAGAVVARALGVRGAVACFPAACATGLVSVLAAAREVASGRAELALAGASEASLTAFIHAGFLRMGALVVERQTADRRLEAGGTAAATAYSLQPTACRAVRPFDRSRQGFLLAEGAAVLVLEPAGRAARRGGRVRALLAGGAEACDAHDAVAPHPDGAGLGAAAELAMERAGCRSDGLAGLWLHGTATRAGDEAELRAAARTLSGAGRAVPATATKGLTGHLLGASGAVELAFAALCLEAGRLPAVANLADPMPGTGALRLIRGAAPAISEPGPLLVLSAGFGGHCAAAVVRPA
ncbi:MAG TPA: beta-ketoacyl synthase N-terminal-like domain-containing protein [Planctomycetota bacterium]|nr:beta-ketoacyl synthase N-terminal-like domain-containing protein [Planctomycetota bacterium]